MSWALFLLSCNAAPLDWRSYGLAPDAFAPWGHPSDVHCKRRHPNDSLEVNGFLLCSNDGPTPIDDPIFTGCSDTSAALAAADDVFYVFDGETAKAWPVALLDGRREVFHDVQGGTEIVGLF